MGDGTCTGAAGVGAGTDTRLAVLFFFSRGIFYLAFCVITLGLPLHLNFRSVLPLLPSTDRTQIAMAALSGPPRPRWRTVFRTFLMHRQKRALCDLLRCIISYNEYARKNNSPC